MPEICFCITGNYLHHTKRYFETEEEAIKHILEIIKMKEDWVTLEQAHKSYQIIKIDTTKCPSYKKLFKKSENIRKPKPQTKKEKTASLEAPQSLIALEVVSS
jgi:hypothetical protein